MNQVPFRPERGGGRLAAFVGAVVMAFVFAATMGTGAAHAAPVSSATLVVPQTRVMALESDEEGDWVLARVCGAPIVTILSHDSGATTRTGQKSVFVTVEFDGADITDIYHNGILVLHTENARGDLVRHTVSLELVEGTNTVRFVGTETCSSPDGQPGEATIYETYIEYDSGEHVPGENEQDPGGWGLSLTGGVSMLWGLIVGILLTLFGLWFVRRSKRRDEEKSEAFGR